MKLSILRSALIVVLILAGGCLNFAFAIDENYAAPQLRGNQIRKDSSSVVADTVYFNPLLKPTQTTNLVRNLITFRIDEGNLKKLPDIFEVILEIKVYYKKQVGSSTVLDSTGSLYLKVSYNKNGTYDYRSIQTFTGGVEAKVVIKNITLGSTTILADIQDVLILENEVFVNREYQFSCTANAIPAVGFDDGEVLTTGELEVNWGKDRAADEYDLEWTYIDDSALADYKTDPTTYSANAIFLRNATRVSITSNQYRIPLLYDTKGRLFFRVRAVQVKTDGQRIESNWSSDNTTGLGNYEFDGHDADFNWQASTSFAEEGKRKSVVQYYDGSLRSRQTVTKDNTTNKTIIAESFYDFQGRPVIQVLPSPSLSSIIKYTPRFNTAINGAEYEKEYYDKDIAEVCESGAPAFDTLSGTSQYYSGANPLTNTDFHQYLPKAKGFPFSEVRYLPDNTNRVSRQSGVGDVFQIGQRASRYYYGTAEQEELDALFGTEVGNNSHYFKNMVRDANGQYSVSYVDMLGRTIATALAGNAVMNMEKLASNSEVKVLKKLLDEKNNIIKGTTIESSRSILVPKKGEYFFKYSLIPDSLTIKDCEDLPVCYDCRYDLEITIADECGNAPYVIRKNNVSLETSCGTIQGFPAVSDTVNLEEGNYLVTKKLTINKAAMDYYRSVFLDRNTCKTFDTFLEEQRTALTTLTCEPSCATCTDQLGSEEQFTTNYFNALGITNAAERIQRKREAELAFDRLKRDCDALCNRLDNHQLVKEMMLADVTPPYGQYANPASGVLDWYSIFGYSLFDFQEKFRKSSLDYYNEKGVPENPKNLSKDDFVSKFKPTWAEALIKVHPEYNKLVKYQEIDSCNKGWDIMFQQTETYQEATAKGFLNPANFAGLPARAAFDHNPAFKDPVLHYLGASYKDKLKDSLDWKTGKGLDERKISAWALATIMAHCKSNDASCFDYYELNNQAFNLGADCSGELDMAWRYFREFYLQERREMIQKIIDGISYVGSLAPDSNFTRRFDLGAPNNNAYGYPTTYAQGEQQFKQAIDSNCWYLSKQWLEDLKPCNLTQVQEDQIIARMIQVCKEGGDAQHIYGASTVKPSSTNTDRSFEQVMKSVLGSNYNNNCNVYLISAPKAYGKQPVLAEKEVYGKPDSCECVVINAMYKQYSNRRNGPENFSQYLYRTTKTVITQGAIDTLRKSCNGEIICNYFPKPIKIPAALQCGVEDVCVDCDDVLTNYDRFKSEFPGIVPSKTDTSALQQTNNKLFVKYMNDGLGFGKTAVEYLEFIDQCNAAGKSCESLAKIRMDYKIIPDYDSTHFIGHPDTHTPYKMRDVYYKGWAHIPDSYVNTSGWGRRYGKLDTLCLGNEFTIVTRIRRPARDTSNTIVDLNVSFNQNGHLQKIAPIFYLLKKSATSADTAFVRANTNKIGYVAAGDTTGQVIQKIPDFTDWKIIKIKHTADNYWRVYYNDTLVAERHLDSAVRRLLDFSVGFEGKANNGYVDYFKIYDGNNVLQYVEEFEDNIQSLTNAPLAYRCEDKCQEGFVKHFNKEMGTQFSYAQIDSVYTSKSCALLPPCGDTAVNKLIDLRSTFKNEYYNYGEIRDVDGINTRMWLYGGAGTPGIYRYKDIIKNGVMQLPDSLNIAPLGGGTSYGPYRDSICTGGSIAIEMMMKFDGSFFNYHFYFGPHESSQNLFVEMNSVLTGCWIDYQDDKLGRLGSASNVTEIQNINMKEWTKVKWEFKNYQIGFYLNDTLRKTVPVSSAAKFDLLRGWSVGSGISGLKKMPLAIDWVKYYDGRDSVIYQEDFNDPYNLSRYNDSLHCKKRPCDEEFVIYYNRAQKTNLTYAQIAQVYASKNVLLDICDNNLSLCGRNEPLFPPVLPNQHQPCDDSLMFAVSTATILHEVYKDSILNSFEDRYLAKCLAVSSTEQFTVEHNINEYHYTLYYYDQVGNLVKTVPPSGVDVSKFQWAANWSDSVKLARKNKTFLTPKHKLVTDYRYNTLGQVVEQQSPDGGKSEFYYDRIGRLAISQNAKQRNDVTGPGNTDWKYSYTQYDELGRIKEVGEIKNPIDKEPIVKGMVRDKDQLAQWFTELAGSRSQITSTLYDIPYEGHNEIAQNNMRNRVSAVLISEGGNPTLYNHATLYSYDIHGNVNTLLQDYGLKGFVPNIMNKNDNRFKVIEYDYDLISGKVNQVKYQRGLADQFYHKYKYDAENRLTLVETSIDGFVWQKDARYEYYLHGPLARTVLGDQSVQGVDYAYTLQGWLKGINSTGATSQHDIGGDGKTGSLNNNTARDAYGFSLNYFTGDYQTISANVNPFPGYSAELGTRYNPLYNGNISSMASAIRRFEDRNTFENGPNLFFSYKYDQLNRLVSMDTDTGFQTATNTFAILNSLRGFKERFSYDANGNILSLVRSNKGYDAEMDDLTYKYYPGTNQLRQVTDNIAANKWGVNSWDPIVDIDNQVYTNNYEYDAIGNLIRDSAERIWNIKWTVYGKIQEINRYATAKNPITKIKYSYDASGNRIGKIAEVGSTNKYYTWYVRDAQGNVMSVYKSEGNASDLASLSLEQNERYIYGSSRLGVERKWQGVDGGPWNAAEFYTNGLFKRGERQYELTNHLGNVLATITDKKFGVSSNGTVINYFEPHMVGGMDYYAFGSPMRIAGEKSYRFGFNGKENDNDVKDGEGTQQDYGMRIYDPRLGRFLSVDPISKSYPMLTPYQFASNRPIDGIDLDGMEWKKTVSYDVKTGITNIHFQVKVKILNCSQYTGSMSVLGDEYAKAVKEAFDGVYDEKRKIKYSASAEYEITGTDLTSNDYGVELNDAKRAKVGGVFIAGMNVQAPNTQKNVVSAAGAIETEGSSEITQRNPSVIAKTIVHELVHTANVSHPMDDDNTAEDVDLRPRKYIGADGKMKSTFTPSIGARKSLILSNIMIYTITGFNGSTISQIIKDSGKLKKVSPDQAYIMQKQISEDQNTQTSKSTDNANP